MFNILVYHSKSSRVTKIIAAHSKAPLLVTCGKIA
jgi:hypothetical protein